MPAVCMASGLLLQMAVISTWTRHYVSEDQALLWSAARSWGEGHPRQPNFWGQTYGTTIEIIPAEVLRRFGVSLAVALPVGVLAVNFAGWTALGLAAWRRSQRTLALIAFGLPALLSTRYVILTVAYNTAAARSLAMIGGAVVIGCNRSRWAPYVAVSMTLLATLLDNSVVLIAVPTWIYASSLIIGEGARLRSKRTLLVAAAVLPSLAWVGLTSWWYRVHPEDDLHPAPAFEPSLVRLWENLKILGRYFGMFSPQYSPISIVPLLVLGVLVAVAAWARNRLLGLSALAVVMLTGVILSVPRASDWLPTAYYPAARVLLPLPGAIWMLCFFAFSAGRNRDATLSVRTTPPRGRSTWVQLVVVGLCVTACGVRLVRWREDVVPIRDEAVAYPNYPLADVAQIELECRSVRDVLAGVGPMFVAFDLRTPAYACAGLVADMRTVYPAYERRSWLLREFLAAGTRDFLLVTTNPVGCPAANATCDDLTATMKVVHVRPSSSVTQTWRNLGFDMRAPF